MTQASLLQHNYSWVTPSVFSWGKIELMFNVNHDGYLRTQYMVKKQTKNNIYALMLAHCQLKTQVKKKITL